MKNIMKKTSAAFVACLAAIVVAAFAGCSLNINMNDSSQTSNSMGGNTSTVTEDSASTGGDEESTAESSDEQSTAESSDEQSTESEQESEEEESSETSVMTESEALEVSVDGYQFDDEQIVHDYHTAKEFTKNEEFNEIFKTNAIDAEYDKELKKAMSIRDMRNTTATYTQKWEAEVDVAYDALSRKLADNSEALGQLSASQQEWKDSTAAAEESFGAEAQDNGSEGLLAADTAMMNFYKGRAAVLLEQIYEIDGTITLSDYGL